MADRRLPYVADAESNVFLDAELGRVDGDSREVLRQRVSDAGVVAALGPLATQTTLAAVLAALTDADEGNALVKLEAIRALLAAPITVQNFPVTQQVSGTVAVSNPTANPETGLAKDATLTTRLAAALDADGGAKTHVQNFPASQAVTAVVLPLPAGAAAEATVAKAVDVFKRALKFEPVAGEELRADDVTGGDRYHGLAADATATNAASWTVVRFYRDAAANVLRVRARAAVAWEARSSGWS